jgi:ABC-type anion transport system duplicated permease subunit
MTGLGLAGVAAQPLRRIIFTILLALLVAIAHGAREMGEPLTVLDVQPLSLSRVRPWQWWRQVILPGIFPYYVTGALTATGGSWNASIVAEVASWGNTKLEATGLGSYIAKATEAGDMPRVVLGVIVMSLFVIAFNRLLWRRLYVFAEQKLRFD